MPVRKRGSERDLTRRLRFVIGLAALAVVVLLAWVAGAFVLQTGPVLYRKPRGLGQDQIISAQAYAGAFGIHKGDAFPFLLQVLYDSTLITGIDRASLDQAADLKPFEVRSFRDVEYDLDGRTRVFERQYELQLIDGEAGRIYSLPTIVVRYRLGVANGLAEKAVVPDPISVAKILPDNINPLELRPISDMVADPSRERFTWVLVAFGVLVMVTGIADLTWQAVRPFRDRTPASPRENSAGVAQAYRSLQRGLTNLAPRALHHQIYHILWLVLNRKEGAGWLQEPHLDRVTPEIRPVVVALYARCERAYSSNEIGAGEIALTVDQLNQVLRFYYGASEIEAWKI
jgi:hypothetical protein